MVTTHNGRTFDYRKPVVPDRRNQRFLVRHKIGIEQPTAPVWWQGGVLLDQGPDGACVGFGTTGEYLASPVRGKLSGPDRTKAGYDLAMAHYHRAQQLDDEPGEDYEGTTVLAGMKAGQESGWWDSYWWAESMDEYRSALTLGPVVIGVDFYRDDFNPVNGVLTGTGGIAGGHCMVATGWTPEIRFSNYTGPASRVRNSWGRWGYRSSGNCWVPDSVMQRILFDAGGEASVPVGRHL